MKKICAVALFGAVTAVTLFAEETEDMSILQQTLDEATEIATKTKMNIDYVPSVVSVQRGDKLKLLGANTVYDALEMLPGIQMQVNQLGQIETVVRGFKNPNSAISDKIKVLLDGVPVSSETFSTAGYVMNFPLELVDRIEVLRGPGSTIYGSGAFY